MNTPITPHNIQQSRRVEQLIVGQATSDGAGVKLTRVLTQNLQRRLDPYLMLDAFGSDKADDYIAGFPDHPHRGFETVTYMIAAACYTATALATKVCYRTAACNG